MKRLLPQLMTVAAAAAVAALSRPASAAAGGDSKPVLVSTAGKGWKSLAELKKAAEAHDPKACSEYGDALVKGDGVDQDVAKGLAFLEEAAAKDEASALFRLGKICDDGALAPQDYAKAFACYADAAKAGVVEAQYNLGVLYATGRGTQRDYVEGLAWLIVATKNGAAGDGEKRTRDQLLKLKKPQQIQAAEQRAEEILKNPAAAASEAKPSGGFSLKKAETPPAKIDLGGTAPANQPAPLAPAAMPGFAPNLSLPSAPAAPASSGPAAKPQS